ncbi:MAG: cupredoxin domain-containing protein [Pseudonocardiaceae bacterium]
MMGHHFRGYANRHISALIAVVFALVLAACGVAGPKNTPAQAVGVAPASDVTVTIENFAFLPAQVTVPPGATVTVVNKDQVIHTLTANNRAFNTGNVNRGIATTFKAPDQPGTYPFHCSIHPYMTGVLTVS